MRLEVIFHRKGFLPMLDPSNLTRRKAYKTRVKGIWHCVENVSINCPFFKKQIGYACTFSTQNSKPRFMQKLLAKIYATNLAELTFFNLDYAKLLRLEKRSKDGSEMASSFTKLFKASCASKLKFFIFFSILPLSLPNVPLNWLEQTDYDFFS